MTGVDEGHDEGDDDEEKVHGPGYVDKVYCCFHEEANGDREGIPEMGGERGNEENWKVKIKEIQGGIKNDTRVERKWEKD